MEQTVGLPASHRSTPSSRSTSPTPRLVALVFITLLFVSCSSTDTEDTLARVKSAGVLVYGSDKEGGGPYIFPDPENPRNVTGFEVELINDLAHDLGVRPEFSQGQWDRLLQNLDAGR